MSDITINRDSWHYKFWSGTFSIYRSLPQQPSFCSYCQRIFWHGLWFLFRLAFVLGVVSIAAYMVFVEGFYRHTKAAFIVTGGGMGLIAVVFGFVSLVMWLDERPTPTRTNKRQSLLGAWLSAKKRKVCPLVKFDH